MKTKKTRKEAIRLAIFSIRNIYRAVIAGEFSRVYGKKLAEQYLENLSLSDHEKFRYFGLLSDVGIRWYNGMVSPLEWLLEEEREECVVALRFFGLIEEKAKKQQAV
jgi:hypothetical protein